MRRRQLCRRRCPEGSHAYASDPLHDREHLFRREKVRGRLGRLEDGGHEVVVAEKALRRGRLYSIRGSDSPVTGAAIRVNVASGVRDRISPVGRVTLSFLFDMRFGTKNERIAMVERAAHGLQPDGSGSRRRVLDTARSGPNIRAGCVPVAS